IGGLGDDTFQIDGGSTLLFSEMSLIGGPGDDTYLITPVDIKEIIERENEGTDTVVGRSTGAFGFVLPDNVENYLSVMTDPYGRIAGHVTGNVLANTLRGDPNGNNPDVFYGMGGNDTLIGLGGNDTLDGGSGLDTAVFSGIASAYTVTLLSNGNVRVV